jgi:transcriptional regulator with XRE-family HTH domain
MDHEARRRLARTGDISKGAASFRLRAARQSLLPRRSQKAMAQEFGVPITTYAAWENGDVFPSAEVIRHFLLEHDIDFNFVMFGDWRRLPVDVQERVFDSMLALQTRLEQKASSG